MPAGANEGRERVQEGGKEYTIPPSTGYHPGRHVYYSDIAYQTADVSSFDDDN